AGILRDVSFHKMSVEQWNAVLAVHLTGTMNVTHAAWPHLREQGYGRIVNTTSAAGLYGNFGQVNYGAAKLGIVGLTKSLAQEGAKKNIRTNCIAPVAKSRMTETIGLPPAVLDRLEPERVSPLVAYLASEGCEENGQTFSVGGGYMAKVAIVEAQGAVLGDAPSPEDVAGRWGDITNMDGADAFDSAMSAVKKALSAK
ncbi:MAG: SDR family NAD(P)-dependent oxidoreductase, partial [Myxococcota bacterium]